MEDLNGAGTDLIELSRRAVGMGHATIEASMRAAYLAMVIDPAFQCVVAGLGALAVHDGDGVPDVDEGSIALVFDGDPERARVEKGGVAETYELGALATERIRDSLERWPRAYLFGDEDGAAPKRMNAFWLWSTDVLSECAGHALTAFGLRCARVRSDAFV